MYLIVAVNPLGIEKFKKVYSVNSKKNLAYFSMIKVEVYFTGTSTFLFQFLKVYLFRLGFLCIVLVYKGCENILKTYLNI